MKKTILLVTALFVSFTIVKADPAKKVNLSYQDGKLKVEALHNVKNPSSHFIDQMVVKVNGKEGKTINFKKQSSGTSQVTEIAMPNLKKGDKVEVVARCNEFGKKTGKLNIE